MSYLFPDFSKASILVIGDVMLDRYWFGDAARLSPEAPVPVVNIKQIHDRPGGAGNVAVNISALGARVTLIGVTGQDEASQILHDQLTEAGVTPVLHQIENLSTITKLRVLSRHQQLIRLDFEEKSLAIDPESLIDLYEKHLSYCDLIILSDYNKGSLRCIPSLIQLARQAGIPILVDPKGNDFQMYAGANVITPNLKEFETIVGVCHDEQELNQKGQDLLKQLKIDSLLLTRGDRGMTLIRQHQEELHLPAHAREVFDVTGAGDTVIATLGAALAAGAEISQAMYLANHAASLVVAKLGAATISTPELEAACAASVSHTSGIMNEEQLISAINAVRAKGQKIVFTNGCFDILHAGHVTYLQQAKQLGDFLVVAVNDDDSVKRLNKAPGRPINTVMNRLSVLASLGMVDWVIPFADDTPERLLKNIRPDILVKGGDYTPEQVIGASIVQAYGGLVRVLGAVKNISTTQIINRMIESYHHC